MGVGPSISVAVDNTLGDFSPNQGALYVAYTGGGGINTDVYLVSSDFLTPGSTPAWNKPVKVNDDATIGDVLNGQYLESRVGSAQFVEPR